MRFLISLLTGFFSALFVLQALGKPYDPLVIGLISIVSSTVIELVLRLTKLG